MIGNSQFTNEDQHYSSLVILEPSESARKRFEMSPELASLKLEIESAPPGHITDSYERVLKSFEDTFGDRSPVEYGLLKQELMSTLVLTTSIYQTIAEGIKEYFETNDKSRLPDVKTLFESNVFIGLRITEEGKEMIVNKIIEIATLVDDLKPVAKILPSLLRERNEGETSEVLARIKNSLIAQVISPSAVRRNLDWQEGYSRQNSNPPKNKRGYNEFLSTYDMDRLATVLNLDSIK